MSRLTLIAIVVTMSFSHLRAQSSPAETGIEGVISIGPTHGGPARVGVPSSRPLGDTDFIVAGEKEMQASFKTDDQGQFRIQLPPGHYQVAKKEKSRLGGCGPFEVDVAAGQMTKVEWSCDSGMR